METPYYCKYPKRLQEVKKYPTLNAIDYLEVLDSLATLSLAEGLRQRILDGQRWHPGVRINLAELL